METIGGVAAVSMLIFVIIRHIGLHSRSHKADFTKCRNHNRSRSRCRPVVIMGVVALVIVVVTVVVVAVLVVSPRSGSRGCSHRPRCSCSHRCNSWSGRSGSFFCSCKPNSSNSVNLVGELSEVVLMLVIVRIAATTVVVVVAVTVVVVVAVE